MQDLRSVTYHELCVLTESLGEKSYRAEQLFAWLHKEHATTYDEMTNLPKMFRERLRAECELVTLRKTGARTSKDGEGKYLFTLPDGNVIESVLMKYHYGNSVCVSSQVGCAMGCAFCASAIGGKTRNLTASEMLEQIYRIEGITGERVSRTVVMGMGEPFDNYDNLIRFIDLICDERGHRMSRRGITVSTCGLVPEIRRFAEDDRGVTLAISLHSADDAVRKKLMPGASKYTVREVRDAAVYYFERTGRRVTFEYSLIRGVNDSDADARRLVQLIGGFPCHINLIPVNHVDGRRFVPPCREGLSKFQNKLEKCGINVTMRRGIARSVNGACGQLRKSFIDPV